MTHHITQEQAVALSIKAGDDLAIYEAEFYTNLCNAAIQYYLDQHKAELPVFPGPYFGSGRYLGAAGSRDAYTTTQIQTYGAACAAQARKLALEEAMQACKQLEIAIDGGGNTYYRPADARQCVSAIETLKGK